MVREATEERTAGESLKRADSGRKGGGGELRKKKPNISKSKKGEREEARCHSSLLSDFLMNLKSVL